MIQPKRKTVIQKGTTLSYNPDNFKPESFFHIVDDPEVLMSMIKPFEGKYISFDTETNPTILKNWQIPTGVVRRWIRSGAKTVPQDFPFCISICDGIGCYSIFDTMENRFAKFKALGKLFADESIEKIAHNTKYDMHMLANIGITIRGKLHDTVVMSKLANENRNSFKLMDLASELETGIVAYEYMVDSYKKTHKIVDYRDIPRPLLGAYANADVWNCLEVFKAEREVIIKEELEKLYDTEMELMLALWTMERYGMTADLGYEQGLKDDLQALVDAAETSIYEEAGSMFNINSGKQLYGILLKLNAENAHHIKMSDKGNPVLDKDALNDLAENHGISIVIKILEFRKYEKLLGTYATGIYAQRDASNKVHGSINQTEATTGRMSVTKPALQTLPKKDKRIRKVFIPAEGFRLWFMDLDQIEYRLFAHYAQSTGLIEAIHHGKDVHQATAAIIYNVPYDMVTDEQRTRAKTVNFSLIYGQGDAASAASLKMTVSDARRFKDTYFAQIPEAAPFIAQVQRVTKTRGYIKNAYGRRRRLKYEECYKAPNALIQGCAADYIKDKIVDIYKFLKGNNFKSRMIMVVHDEIIFEVHDSEEHIIPKLRQLLSEFEAFRVPITAGVEYGNPSWGEKEKPTDIGFAEPSEEEYKLMLNYNVFDGSVFKL
jgi:DNA polymerase-1